MHVIKSNPSFMLTRHAGQRLDSPTEILKMNESKQNTIETQFIEGAGV